MTSRTPKLRGARRYYKAIRDKAERFEIPRLGTWYDLWHTHIDWRGLPGNRHSRDHLAALFTVLHRVEKQAETLDRLHQVWAVIDTSDAAQDAVYLHTPNPNKDNFPFPFEGVTWGVEVPSMLLGFVSPQDYEIGITKPRGLVYWLRSRKSSNQALERTADQRVNLLSMTSTLKPKAKLPLVSGRSACSR